MGDGNVQFSIPPKWSYKYMYFEFYHYLSSQFLIPCCTCGVPKYGVKLLGFAQLVPTESTCWLILILHITFHNKWRHIGQAGSTFIELLVFADFMQIMEETYIWHSTLMTSLSKLQYPHHQQTGVGSEWLVFFSTSSPYNKVSTS